jgi:hypothetical protein
MKLTCGSACIEEILFIKIYNLSKDKHISSFIPLSIMALKAKQVVSKLHWRGW